MKDPLETRARARLTLVLTGAALACGCAGLQLVWAAGLGPSDLIAGLGVTLLILALD